jgi:hypothetical protein
MTPRVVYDINVVVSATLKTGSIPAYPLLHSGGVTGGEAGRRLQS